MEASTSVTGDTSYMTPCKWSRKRRITLLDNVPGVLAKTAGARRPQVHAQEIQNSKRVFWKDHSIVSIPWPAQKIILVFLLCISSDPPALTNDVSLISGVQLPSSLTSSLHPCLICLRLSVQNLRSDQLDDHMVCVVHWEHTFING